MQCFLCVVMSIISSCFICKIWISEASMVFHFQLSLPSIPVTQSCSRPSWPELLKAHFHTTKTCRKFRSFLSCPMDMFLPKLSRIYEENDPLPFFKARLQSGTATIRDRWMMGFCCVSFLSCCSQAERWVHQNVFQSQNFWMILNASKSFLNHSRCWGWGLWLFVVQRLCWAWAWNLMAAVRKHLVWVI